MFVALGFLAMLGHDDPTRALRKIDPDRNAIYTAHWALIVGINDYPHGRKLKNAVADATAVRKALGKYGFADERVFLLTDGAATKAALDAALDDLCDKEKVRENDCVFVFFAGHGVKEKLDTSLLLADTTYAMADKSPVGKTFKLRDIRRRLIEDCPAKHKLLVLDCCHAGNVFQLDGETYDPRNPTPTEGAFKARQVVQAITSTRATETGSDGGQAEANSPFTQALVASLDSIPTNLPGRDYHFTTTVLFTTLQARMRESGATRDQTPVCMWLDRHRDGEFHFFPDRAAKFARRFDESTMLLAMTPTTYGNWWADEVPWFMPGLRHHILAHPTANRSDAIRQLDGDNLRAAADAVCRDMEASKVEINKTRGQHLRLMLDAGGRPGAREDAMKKVIDSLKNLVKDAATADPLDLHYLAVLEHKQALGKEAREHFKQAIGRYESLIENDKKMPSAGTNLHRPLYALCLSDRATFLLANNEFQAAADGFRAAWGVYAVEAPAPFKVYTQMKEAEAFRRAGHPGLTTDRLQAATVAISSTDPKWTTPLAAATLKQFAWADMERWKFKTAREKFEHGQQRLLDLNREGGRDEYKFDQLHIEHGLAMVERYQGRPENALRQYRTLTPKIARAIDDLASRRHNHVEVRYLLYSRLVNSLQRQADCSLFAPTPDYAEAADDYRRALLAVDFLDDDQQDGERVSHLYCRTIALAAPSPTRDLERARHLFAEAEAIHATKAKFPLQTELCRSIAFTLLGEPEPSTLPTGEDADCQTPLLPFEKLSETLRRENRTFDRDELERLMFGYRLLIEKRLAEIAGQPAKPTDAAKARSELLRWSDDLLRLCRQVCKAGGPDPDLLVYLRPYYDLAFLGKLAAVPAGPAPLRHPHAKELVEIAWEATHGEPYQKPAQFGPTLSLYCCRGRGYFLLDAPAFGGHCYTVESVNPSWLRTAGTPETKLPPLPVELLADLRRLEADSIRAGEEEHIPLKEPVPSVTTPAGHPGGSILIVRWADPVLRLGYTHPRTTRKPDAKPAPVTAFRYDLDTLKFPFDLKVAVRDGWYAKCTSEPKFEPHTPWPLPWAAVAK